MGCELLTNKAQGTTDGRPKVDRVEISGNVPGDVITDLEKAGVVEDPYYELNFATQSFQWTGRQWTYRKNFTLPAQTLLEQSANGATLLVFEGIKMGAVVSINSLTLGMVTDQFSRTVFAVPAEALTGEIETISVAFDSSIDCQNRWMACTGGWDWAPYSGTFDSHGSPTFSFGIWKSVYIVSVPSGEATISHVKPLVFYRDLLPFSPISDGNHAGFDVSVTTYLWSPMTVSGILQIDTQWGESATQSITVEPQENFLDSFAVAMKLSASASQIRLWWPGSSGLHPLYWVNVTFTPQKEQSIKSALSPMTANPVSVSRRIGFRTFALVTVNDTDPAIRELAKGQQGTGDTGMFFRVNGAPIYSRGANMIPMEEMEGRMSDLAHAQLVQSAASANMNTLRVWGGGIFLPTPFYDACDELGILIFHDMQYATGGLHDNGGGPQYVKVQYDEMRHQLRRLSHHPSIVIWDGCNECSGADLYSSFVMTTVVEEDSSRVVWPACPSSGWETGVDLLTQMPNGKRLFIRQAGNQIESHGPYFHGSGFPAVNGGIHGPDIAWKPVPFDPLIPLPIVAPATPTGPQYRNVFTSEFGASVFSSFESMTPTLAENHWGVHGGAPPDDCTLGFFSVCTGNNSMSQRNYPCDGTIMTMFDINDFDAVGEKAFKKHLYLCLISQGLLMKQQIELMRSGNTFGTLTWQLNEIWPTGGWGSLEYGAAGFTKGQVIGGRWKPLHHFMAQNIYKDILGTCGANGLCFVRNDQITPFEGSVTVSSISLADGSQTVILKSNIQLAAGAGTTEFFTLPSVPDSSKNVLNITVSSAHGSVANENIVLLAPPKNLSLQQASVTIDASSTEPQVTLRSDQVALFVTLTTLAQGRFDENAFLLVPNVPKVVKFIPFTGFDGKEFTESVRVEHLTTY